VQLGTKTPFYGTKNLTLPHYFYILNKCIKGKEELPYTAAPARATIPSLGFPFPPSADINQ